MPVVGSQRTLVSGINVAIVLNGNLYAMATRFKASWGNQLDEEAVAGTDIPAIIPAKFHGEIELEVLYSTEDTAAMEQFTSLMQPVKGAVPAIDLQWTGTDVTGSEVFFTLAGGLVPKETSWSVAGEKVVKAKISGVMASRPVLRSNRVLSYGLDTPPLPVLPLNLDGTGALDT